MQSIADEIEPAKEGNHGTGGGEQSFATLAANSRRRPCSAQAHWIASAARLANSSRGRTAPSGAGLNDTGAGHQGPPAPIVGLVPLRHWVRRAAGVGQLSFASARDSAASCCVGRSEESVEH